MYSSLFSRIILLLCIVLPSSTFAAFTFTPSGSIDIKGSLIDPVLGTIAFSNGAISWVPPATKATIDSNYVLHGNVWIDAIGWSTFDHGITGSMASIDNTCMNDTTLTICPVTGFLWNHTAGWIRIGNNPAASSPDILYTKSTGVLSGYAWNNLVGWIPINGVGFWVNPIIPSLGGPLVPLPTAYDFYAFASGSMTLPFSIPSYVSDAGTITLTICNSDGVCTLYTYDTIIGGFPLVNLSIAGTYTYTITDPFGSKTEGLYQVFANKIDISRSTASGDLSQGGVLSAKLADGIEIFSATFTLRDIYGNSVKDEPIIGQLVKFSVNIFGDAVENSVIQGSEYYGGRDLSFGPIESALQHYAGGSPVLFGTYPYIPGQTFAISSFAPTIDIPTNDVSLSSITIDVFGPNSQPGVDISTLFKTSPTDTLPFKPLYEVSDIIGFSDIQMGRPALFTGSIVKNDLGNVSSSGYIIHGLSIVTTLGGVANVASTFQDMSSSTVPANADCFAFYTGSVGVNYNGYCDREPSLLGERATVLSLPIDMSIPSGTTQEHNFTTTPRRISTIDIEQEYIYDSIIRYIVSTPLGPKVITFPSLTTATLMSDKVFAGAVKIIGQASGDRIYQSITDMYQPKNASLSRTEIINEVRKNIAILTRSVDYTMNKYTGTTLISYKGDQVIDTAKMGDLITRTSIVVYGDITITDDYNLSSALNTPPKAIIALKDMDGNGGNIYITKDVGRLDLSLIAEGSLFSGEKGRSPSHYSDEVIASNLLLKQLYIFGSVVSLNTIGGASIPGSPSCPQSISPCSGMIPLRYDFEHFRYFRGDPTQVAPLARGADNLSANDKKASLIIEYDSRVISDPPAGLGISR